MRKQFLINVLMRCAHQYEIYVGNHWRKKREKTEEFIGKGL